MIVIFLAFVSFCLFTVYALMACCDFKAWPNARNILTQHLATLLHDVETVIERAVYEP